MQKILICVNHEFYTSDKYLTKLMKKAYGKTKKYWDELFAKDDLNFNNNEQKKMRMDEKVLQAAIDLNFNLGREKYDNEDVIMKIVEVPDDVEWDVRGYEGGIGEYVCEKHRTWD